jgi:hypothetical protein
MGCLSGSSPDSIGCPGDDELLFWDPDAVAQAVVAIVSVLIIRLVVDAVRRQLQVINTEAPANQRCA